ncbi:MAG: Poly(A) polymerase I [Candidatus Dichloromethanomonas elyunquensis]|nr:MAG: Poly(A) polymerase I [Candidatus Dichloromethanomonas elyunquensis]
MNDFQQKIIDIIAKYSPVWLVGGAVRDKLLGLESKDIDLVTYMKPENIDYILRENGFHPQQIGMRFKTLSLFEDGKRIDIVSTEDLGKDASQRDFTINAIYVDPLTEKFYDPWEGSKHLKERRLQTCGNAQDRFREDPVRILRMIKFAVKLNMEIEEKTWEEAKNQVTLLENISKERVSSELAQILVLENAEKAVRLLGEVAYWDVFVPELARLKGIVQNQYHSLDVWEHTLAVFRGTPQDLFLRLAGLFHDVGKWEVASRECYLAGRLVFKNMQYRIEDYQIIGTRGKRELESKLKPLAGKHIKILGANLDQFPETVQFKRILIGENADRGLTFVENGKRHFLNHEKASARILEDILKRYTFSMFFKGAGQKRERSLLKLVENHMQATLTFMPEFRDEPSKRSFRHRAAELVWNISWDGRDFELQNIYDFLVLWKADFDAGKVHSEEQNSLLEKIFKEVITIALWQNENLPKIEWGLCLSFASAEGLSGQSFGKFKDFIRTKLMKEMTVGLSEVFLKKAFAEFNNLDK